MILIKDTAGDTLGGAINGINRVFTTRADFDPDRVHVYLNGLLKVASWDDGYTVTPPRTVTLKEAPVAGDSLEIQYMAPIRGGGGALGGVPAAPQAVALRPSILEVSEEDDD